MTCSGSAGHRAPPTVVPKGSAVTCCKAGPSRLPLPPAPWSPHPCSYHALPTGVPGLREAGGAGALLEASPSWPRGPAGGGPGRHAAPLRLLPAAARGHAQPGAPPAWPISLSHINPMRKSYDHHQGQGTRVKDWVSKAKILRRLFSGLSRWLPCTDKT